MIHHLFGRVGNRTRKGSLVALGVLGLLVASNPTSANAVTPKTSSSITVLDFFPSPPRSALEAFTAQTGINVTWTTVSYDAMESKITAASESHVYFADLTDIDWSQAAEMHETKWFLSLNKYFNIKGLKSADPQVQAFIDDGDLEGVPQDSAFGVTTINKEDFAKAGIDSIPATLSEYTADLQKIKAKGVVTYPLEIPFAAATGLTNYWYEVTAAFGGHLFNASDKPLFTSPSSPGYKALQWMVNAYKDGLVAPGNIDTTDFEGFTAMAQNTAASVVQDHAGNVATLYNVKSDSKVVGQIEYIPVPGVSGPTFSVAAGPDGWGIPATANNVAGAVKFIDWFSETKNQVAWAGGDGPAHAITTYTIPASSAALAVLAKTSAGRAAGVAELASILASHTSPEYTGGAPTWVNTFASTAYTDIHGAAAGSESVAQAIHSMAAEALSLRSSS